VVCGLEGLSPIGVGDVLYGWTHDGHGTVMFPSTTIGRGVFSMLIACVGRTMGKELSCSRQLLLGEESIVW